MSSLSGANSIMIEVLFGDNDYAITNDVKEIKSNFSVESESYEGSEVNLQTLTDICSGLSLFTSERLVFINGLSLNKDVWSAAPDFFTGLSDETKLVLVEPGVDKRTATYKWLKKNANLREFNVWTYRDRNSAIKWIDAQAKELGVDISSTDEGYLIDRAGYNQWYLKSALDKLVLSRDASRTTIDNVIDVQDGDSAYALVDAMLAGNKKRLNELLETVRLQEDPYRIMALLMSQITTLAALVASKGGSNIAKDMGVHPFVVDKLRSSARGLSLINIRELIDIFAEADIRSKTLDVDTWSVVSAACMQAADIIKK